MAFYRGDWQHPNLDAGFLIESGLPELHVATARAELERLGREDLNYHLRAPLADHVAAKALSAQARHAEAAELYARAAAAAPNCRFGQPPTNGR